MSAPDYTKLSLKFKKLQESIKNPPPEKAADVDPELKQAEAIADADIEHIEEQQEKENETRKKLILDKLNKNLIKLPPPDYKSCCTNNLERFHYLCKDLPSPDLFIDYNFNFMVASCLARKVWWGTGNSYIGNLYPNLYLVFVTPPGIGKSLPANTAGRILASLVEHHFSEQEQKFLPRNLINLGPDCITFEKLAIRTARYNDVIPWPNGPVKFYHHSSTTFCLGDEMGMLFSEQTKKVISFLMKAWDCGDFEADTINRGELKIKNVCVNFLGCTTPLIMKDLMKTRVLDNGFTGRTIFIYANKKRKKITDELEVTESQINETRLMSLHFRKLCKLSPTNVTCSPEAREWLRNWVNTKEDIRLNQNPRLEDYYARKQAQLKKLAVCHHYADKLDNIITVEDFIAAERLLLRTEPMMHKALVQAGESATYVISEEMKLYLKQHGETEKKRLQLDFFSLGDWRQLQGALDFLLETAQIRAEKKPDGKMMIRYTGKE